MLESETACARVVLTVFDLFASCFTVPLLSSRCFALASNHSLSVKFFFSSTPHAQCKKIVNAALRPARNDYPPSPENAVVAFLSVRTLASEEDLHRFSVFALQRQAYCFAEESKKCPEMPF
jgi:hypothetical protein